MRYAPNCEGINLPASLSQENQASKSQKETTVPTHYSAMENKHVNGVKGQGIVILATNIIAPGCSSAPG